MELVKGGSGHLVKDMQMIQKEIATMVDDHDEKKDEDHEQGRCELFLKAYRAPEHHRHIHQEPKGHLSRWLDPSRCIYKSRQGYTLKVHIRGLCRRDM